MYRLLPEPEGPEVTEERARFSIKIKTNFKLNSDSPSDLPGLGSWRWSGGLHSSGLPAAYRLPNQLEGQVSKFMFRASVKFEPKAVRRWSDEHGEIKPGSILSQ